ncbi:MAG TPA: protein translocase subunit SecD [Candidatus Azosocius sp. HAIN]
MIKFYNYYKLFNFRFFLFLLFLFISFFYFLPNLYKEQPVININNDNMPISNENINDILFILKNSNFEIKKKSYENNNLSINFFSFEEQLLAKNYIENYLKNKNLNYNISLDTILNIPLFFEKIYSKPMKLGLDLKGGVRFLMEIDYDSIMIKNIENYYNDMKYFLKKENYFYINSNCFNDSFEFVFNSDKNFDLILNYLRNNFSELIFDINYKKKLISFNLSDIKINEIKKFILDKSLISFRKRINELGLSESSVRKYGEKNIIIELPGVQNLNRARNILGKTATINFFMVDNNNIYNSNNKYVPFGSKLFYDKNNIPILLKKKLVLTGDSIISAYSSVNEENKPTVNIQLTNIGAKNFFNITSKNVGKLMAVVYNESFNDGNESYKNLKIKEEVINVAKIMQPLSKSFQITGLNFEEANDLALLLRAGVLPTNIFIIEEKIIGPSLGKENIEKGYNAIIYGLLSVLLFMIFYYNVFGVIANICLLFNLIFLVSFMSILGAVLTLPGIAGIVLTLGMAIDSNVLIFERIREKLLLKNDCKLSINSGYKHALITIIDSNLTTFFVGLLLFIVGDGPIKGFAITLCIGIVTSLYSSIIGTRIIVDVFFKNNVKILPIGL